MENTNFSIAHKCINDMSFFITYEESITVELKF